MIPNNLPAREILEREEIFTISRRRAEKQDIRPLRIALLNIMPTKIVTETQLIRLLSNTPLQVELTLLTTSTHQSKNTPPEHLDAFYKKFDAVSHEKFDGLVVTGAPVETLSFEQVDYWPELCAIMNWSRTNVYSTIYICWGALAGLYYHFGIEKHLLDRKMFGVFRHNVLVPEHPLLRGFDEEYRAPHSRHTGVLREDIDRCPELELLTYSPEAGVNVVGCIDRRSFFVTGHGEYDADTLAGEYFRDLDRGLPIELPKNYFPDDDPSRRPQNVWRGHAHLLFSNWLNYFVYQATPFDITKIDGE